MKLSICQNSLMLILIMTISHNLLAVELTNKALFYRCYRQITQDFPGVDHELVDKVSKGEIDPIEACLSVFNKGLFTANSNNRIADINDAESLNVVQTFQELHHSWFLNKRLPEIPNSAYMMSDVVDIGAPALYFTKALFTPDYQFKNIFSGTTHYESDRTDGKPDKGPSSGRPWATHFETTPDFPLLDVGNIMGVNPFENRTYIGHDYNKNPFDLNIGTHWGGGVLGSQLYLYLTVVEDNNYKANGAEQMPRRWSKSIYNDFFCRDLPVIRYEDGLTYLSSHAEAVPFRKEGACIRCHAAMDPLSSIIRNIRPRSHNAQTKGTDTRNIVYFEKWSVEAGNNGVWREKGEGSFHRRDISGWFLYRTFDGKKVYQDLSTVEELGDIVANLEDPYVCAAKRYYQYFTGINANVDDITDPSYAQTLSSTEIKHRSTVIELGKKFKEHQSLKKLVEEILRKPAMRDSVYREKQ